jgi:hypothetical protein
MLKAKIANNYECLYISYKASNHFAHWAKPDYTHLMAKTIPSQKAPLPPHLKPIFLEQRRVAVCSLFRKGEIGSIFNFFA